jgi:ectoine hydroxylase-related dioxygenase (phytanoyl-CoA dioxygenase family)
VLFRRAIPLSGIEDLVALLGTLPSDRAGIRLHGIAGLGTWLSPAGAVGGFAAAVLGPECRPVRAILFDKNEAANWSLAWHQDRTIAVRQRREVPGFGAWTVKSGIHHVEPPASLQAGMVTLRLHLDPVPESNGPLLIAPGSHRLGRILEADIPEIVRRCGTATCLAKPGDLWLYATPILHASPAATDPTHRRVLQVDYAVGSLPGGLEWLGV